jgi:ribose 5-phosphate isomerase B
VRIAIGSDHRARNLKGLVMRLVVGAGHECEDFGCHNEASVDYPDIARAAAEAVAGGQCDRAVLMCGTGIGMSIAANKVKGIRAALCRNEFGARRARQHGDANVLCLGEEEGIIWVPEIVDAFLTTDFEGGRHQDRVDKISGMER